MSESKANTLQLLMKKDGFKTVEDHEQWFTSLAHEMMNNQVLVINKDNHYRIAEAEFYYQDKETHPDRYVMVNSDVAENGKWHFLKMGQSYACGSYKGLNICFGNKDRGSHGGILIRALASVEENDKGKPVSFVEGPSCSVDRIIYHNDDEGRKTDTKQIHKVKHLVDLPKFSWNCFDDNSRLYFSNPSALTLKNSIQQRKLYRSFRVGLVPRTPNDVCRWWTKEYRFSIFPELQKKKKHLFILNMIRMGIPISQIMLETEARQRTMDELIEWYNKGKATKDDNLTEKIFKYVKSNPIQNKGHAYVYGMTQNL